MCRLQGAGCVAGCVDEVVSMCRCVEAESDRDLLSKGYEEERRKGRKEATVCVVLVLVPWVEMRRDVCERQVD